MRRLLDTLNAAAYYDLTDVGDPERRRRKLNTIVFGVAGCALALELLLTRLFPFYLGSISSFAAIPVAMFGLSLGALALHWRREEPRPETLALLVPLLTVVTFVCLAGSFVLFDHVFNLTHHWRQNPKSDALKTIVLASIFVPPFALVGVILSTAFTAGARDVGRLYALDLVGSALACLAVPLVLVLLDLRYACVLLIAALGAINLVLFGAWHEVLQKVLRRGTAVLAGLAALGVLFVAHPDLRVLGGKYAGDDTKVQEVRHGWNHVSRATLLKFIEPTGRRFFWLVHDDGISNVRVRTYKPEQYAKKRTTKTTQGLPFLLDDPPETALVIFAGCGKDMVEMREYAQGDLAVTGVELNGLVKRLVSLPWHDRWNLRAFFALPDVDLRIAEGRGFLDRDRNRYDLIFVATNGAQNSQRTGHARKFLDTLEAMEVYLDHLAPGGSIVFNYQRIDYKIEIFKRLLKERGHVPFSQAVALFGRREAKVSREADMMILKPSGLTPDEAARMAAKWPDVGGERVRFLKYAPGHAIDWKVSALALRPADPDRFVPTDDRPYERRIVWENFTPIPTDKQFRKIPYSMNWMKIFTLIFFVTASLLVILAFVVRRRGSRRLPLWLVAYFLGTGICYMAVQIGLMAKLELFMGRPLYAIAIVLASFLLMNGAGSAWIDRRQKAGATPPVWGLALGAALFAGLTLVVADGVLAHLLALPVLVKAPLAFATVAPLAFVLGCFYPTGVSLALDRGLQPQIPFTFGLATLASVIGSTWAMVEVINVGFRAMVFQAMAGYLVIALLAGIGGAVVRRR
jgi:hypothetical protein